MSNSGLNATSAPTATVLVSDIRSYGGRGLTAFHLNETMKTQASAMVKSPFLPFGLSDCHLDARLLSIDWLCGLNSVSSSVKWGGSQMIILHYRLVVGMK